MTDLIPRRMQTIRRSAVALLLLLVGCDVFLFPLEEPQGKEVVLGGLNNTSPYFGSYRYNSFDPFDTSRTGTFLLASCGCGDWRVLFKPDDGSSQIQFPILFYSDGEYQETGDITIFGEEESSGRAIRGVAHQDSGLFEGRSDLGEVFQSISAERGDAHNQPVVACGMCHIGEDSIYPLPDTHPDRYKSDPLSCLECHSVNGM